MPSITTELQGKSLVIQFTRPQLRNPLSVDVISDLIEVVDSVYSRNDVEQVIFTGTGDSFASGADLREIAALTAETATEFALRGQSLMTRIAALSMQTIAAVNGYCFGGALDLALACDRRIASPNASFSHPGVSLGIITGWGGTQRLPRLIGRAKALEMFLTAKRVDATEALRIGLIHEIDTEPLASALAASR